MPSSTGILKMTPILGGLIATPTCSGIVYTLCFLRTRRRIKAKEESANCLCSKLDSCARLQKNGQIYAVYHNKINLLPCDKQEQDCLDIFHELFAVIQHNCGLPHASCSTGNAWFLDLGCRTGFRAIDSAKRYPNSYVLGVDIIATQPPNHFLNCEFSTPFDFEWNWVKQEDLWNLIHLQLGCGGMSDWPSVYHQANAHLHPSDWFEQLKIDFEPCCDNSSLNGMTLPYWYQQLKKATEKLGHPLAHSFHETVAELCKAGFAEILHSCIKLLLSPWHLDVWSRNIGCWYNLTITQSIKTLSLALQSCVWMAPKHNPTSCCWCEVRHSSNMCLQL